MKTKNVTFSLPLDIVELLQSLVEKNKMSNFASDVLEEALLKKRELLKKDYIDASKDLERLKTIEDWSITETEDWE